MADTILWKCYVDGVTFQPFPELRGVCQDLWDIHVFHGSIYDPGSFGPSTPYTPTYYELDYMRVGITGFGSGEGFNENFDRDGLRFVRNDVFWDGGEDPFEFKGDWPGPSGIPAPDFLRTGPWGGFSPGAKEGPNPFLNYWAGTDFTHMPGDGTMQIHIPTWDSSHGGPYNGAPSWYNIGELALFGDENPDTFIILPYEDVYWTWRVKCTSPSWLEANTRVTGFLRQQTLASEFMEMMIFSDKVRFVTEGETPGGDFGFRVYDVPVNLADGAWHTIGYSKHGHSAPVCPGIGVNPTPGPPPEGKIRLHNLVYAPR